MRKFFSLKGIILLLIAALLAGCGANGDDAAGNETGSATGSSNEPVDLYLYSASGGSPEWFETNYGKYLKEEFPHINFNVYFPSDVTIQDYIASGEPVDIVFGSFTTIYQNLINLNLQTDISDEIKAHNIDLDKIDPAVIGLMRQLADGGIYGLPAFIGTSGLYYNKDIFDKFAVEYPTDDMTWDDVYDLAVKLTRSDGGEQYYGFANDNRNYIIYNQLSLDMVDPETLTAAFNTDDWARLIQTFARFMTIDGLDPNEATVAAFNTVGNVAMATNYTGCCGATPGDAVTNWDVVRIPDFPGRPNVGPQVVPNYWNMSSISQNREAAFEVIAYIVSEEFQTSLNSRGLATVLRDTDLHAQYGSELPFYNGKNVKALFPKPAAESSNVTEYHIEAAAEINNALNQVALEGIDVNTALRTAAERLNQTIQAAEAAKSEGK